MQTNERGFTVIELLIVLVLLSILAAIAYPRYEAYSTRSKVAAVLKLANNDTQKLSQYYAKNGSMPQGKAAAKQAGVAPTPAVDSRYLKKSQYQNTAAKNGKKAAAKLTYTLTGIGSGVNDKTIRLSSGVQNGQLQWRCASAQIAADYLPSRCHATAK